VTVTQAPSVSGVNKPFIFAVRVAAQPRVTSSGWTNPANSGIYILFSAVLQKYESVSSPERPKEWEMI
jgi:hypothetical protein